MIDSSYSKMNFEYSTNEKGTNKIIKIKSYSIFIVLSGVFCMKSSDYSVFINANIDNKVAFVLKKNDFLSFSFKAETHMIIFSFEIPLVIKGYQPILSLYKAKIKEKKSDSEIHILPIKNALSDYIHYVKSALSNKLCCANFNEYASSTIFFLLKNLYSEEELRIFFSPLVDSLNKSLSFREFVELNYEKDYSVVKLAKMGHYSLSDFKRKFKEEFNDNPGHWIHNRRKENIYNSLLNKNLSLVELKEKFKFSSLDYFYQFCKKEFHCHPRDFVPCHAEENTLNDNSH